MPAQKIVLIGAGSAIFGPNTLATILRSQSLRGSQIGLVDLNEAGLATVARVAERMNDEWGAEMTIRASTDRRDVLAGADFVICSIEVPPREALWRLDWEVPMRHGLRQPFGENGGPGGLMHACRQIPPFMAIVGDMEELCPDAWLINFSNPLPRITRAISKYSRIRTVGKCHQINVAYAIAAVLLRDRYGIDVPDDVAFNSNTDNAPVIHQLAAAGRNHVDIKVAGLNHFIWMMDVHDRETGQDLYPALRAARADAPLSLEPLSMELFEIFDLCPAPGDTHLVEYLPWGHDATTRPWEHYQIPLYDWGANEAFRDFMNHMLGQMAEGSMPIDGLRDAPSEGAVEVIEGIGGNLNAYVETVNIPNRGAIGNLPEETIVELPGIFSGRGVQAVQMGPLPEPVAELCRREAALVEMVVDTAVSGDRQLALQTLLLDPMINDIGRARAILDDYLKTFEAYLPQF